MGTEAITGTGADLGKDAYLQLLMVQMKNQDPLNPVDNNQFMADLAQFSSLEQMVNMNDSLEKILDAVSDGSGSDASMEDLVRAQTGTWQLSELRAAEEMIGKRVTFANPNADTGLDAGSDPDSPAALTERVSSVVLKDGAVWLATGNYHLNISDVQRIEE